MLPSEVWEQVREQFYLTEMTTQTKLRDECKFSGVVRRTRSERCIATGTRWAVAPGTLRSSMTFGGSVCVSTTPRSRARGLSRDQVTSRVYRIGSAHFDSLVHGHVEVPPLSQARDGSNFL
ncbi:hypothetical protein GQ600_20924 [Phytophthora cactorum]|nr:hypothetical protein GQ600_20924 [Phytophthora cactorum]